MKKVLIVVGLAAVAAGAWFVFRGGEASEQEAVENDAMPKVRRIGAAGEKSQAREKIDAAAADIKNRQGRRGSRVRVASGEDAEALWIFEDGTPWPEEQKELMRAISSAADSDNFDAVVALASDVAKCKNAELREKFVEELGWFGEKAFVELANFISDPDEDVSDAARTQITDAYQEIESDAEKAAIFTLMSKAVSDDDLLETFADELTVMDEVLALQTIVDTLDDGTPKAKKVVREAYENITDEKWTDVEAAEKWLENNWDGDDDSDDDEPSGKSKAKSKKSSKSKDSESNTSSSSSTSRRSSKRSGTSQNVDQVEQDAAAGEGDDVGEGEVEVDGDGEEVENEKEDDLGEEDLEEELDEEGDGEVDEDGSPIQQATAPVE